MFLGDTILNNLLDWIKIHYENAENQASVIIDNTIAYLTDERVEEKFTFYWDTVIGLVLQGNIDLARKLLSNHSQSDTEPFIHAIKIFKSMPTYSVSFTLFTLQFYSILKSAFLLVEFLGNKFRWCNNLQITDLSFMLHSVNQDVMTIVQQSSLHF